MSAADGWTAEQIFAPPAPGYALDDVVFLPSDKPTKSDVQVLAKLTQNVTLKMPIIGSTMTDVTEENMAIGLAHMGGIGFIHRNQSIEDQAAKVRQVKEYETGFLLQVRTLGPRNTVADALRLMAEVGCSGIPITDNGKMGGRLKGILSRRDIDGVEDVTAKLSQYVTTDVVTICEPVILVEAREKMQQAKVAKLPVVNSDKELVALVCRADMKKEKENPLASRDGNKSLLCGASVSTREPEVWDRICALVNAGVDCLCVDTDEIVDTDTLALIREVKRELEGTDLLIGPVRSVFQAKELCEAGADGIYVGCTGSEATDVYHIAKYCRVTFGVPVMLDCNAQNIGQMMKAFCLGASTVALGQAQMLGTEETPGDYFYRDGVRRKLPHGSVPSGRAVGMATADVVVNRGSIKTLVAHDLRAIKYGLRELGLSNVLEVHSSLSTGHLRLERQRAPEEVEQPVQLHRVVIPTLHNQW